MSFPNSTKHNHHHHHQRPSYDEDSLLFHIQMNMNEAPNIIIALKTKADD
jgi:hypothetical protein